MFSQNNRRWAENHISDSLIVNGLDGFFLAVDPVNRALDEFKGRRDMQFVADMLAVRFYGLDAQVQLIGDLTRPISLPDELEDLKFPIAQEIGGGLGALTRGGG